MTTTTTDNTTTTKQTKPPALVIAVLNEKKYIIENLSIPGTVVDMNLIDDVMSGLYEPNSNNLYENDLLMEVGRYALMDMTQYFILHTIYSALSTYTRKNAFGFYFTEHIKKETGMDISLRKIKSSIRVCHPHVRKIFQCFGTLAYNSDNHFNVYGFECKPNDAAGFRIWIRSELDAMAKRIEMIEPCLGALPGAIHFHINKREDAAKRKREFMLSIKKRIPYIEKT